MDYGKYKYENSKKEHVSRRHQKSTQLKEIKLRPRTGRHDLDIKVRQIKAFLAEGNKTKVTVTFRGHIPPSARKLKVVLIPDAGSPDTLIVDQPILRYARGNDLALEGIFPYLRYEE